MTQAYIIIDMQNDFIDGALGSAQAQAVVPRIEAVHHVGHHPGRAILWLSGPGR